MRAFTLTEMMVVLVIIGLIAAVIGPRLFNRLDEAKRRTALLQISNLDAGIDLFRTDVGRLPTASEGLQSLMVSLPNLPDWSGPYLSKSTVPKDPWGHDFEYEVAADGSSYRVTSLGSDGRPGGAGSAQDITTNKEFGVPVSAPSATVSAAGGCVSSSVGNCPPTAVSVP